LRFKLCLFGSNRSFVDHEFGATFKNGSRQLGSVDFKIQPRFTAATTASGSSGRRICDPLARESSLRICHDRE
jgi:hypothetical protein